MALSYAHCNCFMGNLGIPVKSNAVGSDTLRTFVLQFSIVPCSSHTIFCNSFEKKIKINCEFTICLTAVLFAVLVSTGIMLFYYSAERIPISLASPIFCTSPLITAILSAFMFKERLLPHQYFSLFVILFSMFLL